MSQTASPFIQRHASLANALQNSGLGALAVNPSMTLTYLTGLHFHLMERPVVFLFIPHTPPIVVLPELEAGKLQTLPFAVQAFPYSEDPAVWPAVFRQAAQSARLDNRLVGVEPRALRFLELRLLEAALPEAQFVSGEAALTSLRIRKDASEVANMRRAVEIAQAALEATLPMIRAGVTERQIASELTLQLLRAGSAPEMPFQPIVASGPHSANPHSVPTDRSLAPGDLLIIDWGATYESYISDLTRTFAIGTVEPELRHIVEVVEQANQAGRAAVQPGVTAGSVDQAARAVIDQAGYGQYFIHRTGHGIGMEGHEEPYIYGQNQVVLEPGMAFTIEPGIYLTGRGGVRIEDNVVISEKGADVLSNLPRALRMLPG